MCNLFECRVCRVSVGSSVGSKPHVTQLLCHRVGSSPIYARADTSCVPLLYISSFLFYIAKKISQPLHNDTETVLHGLQTLHPTLHSPYTPYTFIKTFLILEVLT